ncbi:MAG: DUF255 domain-containing protein [Campylobacterota bacterium]|nr:DUF255 domain-containing protein [Campylobacterota bacterium]
MKQPLFFIVVLFFLHVNLKANEIHWFHNYDKAIKEAIIQNKKLFVLITSETCRWCRQLEHNTLEDKSIVDRISKKYISVALTRGKDSYPKILKAKMVPMSYYLNNDGSIISTVPGYWGVEDYHTVLNDVNYYLRKEDLK